MTAERVKPRQITKAKQKADKQTIANLAVNHDLSCRQIAAITGKGKTRVAEIIQDVKTNQDFTDFQTNKDKVFENLQYRLINLADDDLLKSMLNKRGFTDTAILQDKIQLLRGQATSISEVDIRHLIANVIAK
jgi:protein-arginine kinase activator protein McsA